MERQIRLCDCNRSFTVDEKALAAGIPGPLKVHHELCRREIGEFESALACGDVLVGCTQEAALFAEVAAERAATRIDFFNLRENAGWSAEGRGATPKMAALIAAATLPEPEPVAGVTLAAGNNLLIVGESGAALGWAERLAGRFEVSVLLTGTSRDAELPLERRYPVWSGAGVTLSGHLGAFDAVWAQHNPIDLVKNWKTPTLVIHGAQDFRVVETGGMATFTALQRRGIPSRFLYFPDENHWVLKPANSILWHETVIGWIDQWTKK